MKSRTILLIGAIFVVCLFSYLGLATAQAAPEKGAAPAQQPAASSTPSGQYKIGVVNRKGVLKGYDKVKNEMDKLQANVNDRQVKMDATWKKIEDAKKAYEAKKDSMTSEARIQEEEAIKRNFRQYQTDLANEQTAIDIQEQTIMKQVVGEIDAAIQKVGESGNYHLIVEGGSSGAVYYQTSVDVTPQVIALLNSGQQK